MNKSQICFSLHSSRSSGPYRSGSQTLLCITVCLGAFEKLILWLDLDIKNQFLELWVWIFSRFLRQFVYSILKTTEFYWFLLFEPKVLEDLFFEERNSVNASLPFETFKMTICFLLWVCVTPVPEWPAPEGLWTMSYSLHSSCMLGQLSANTW